MKELGFYNVCNEYNKNRMFDPKFKSPIGDDLSYPTRYLAKEAKKKGIHVSTIDTQLLNSYDAIVFFDFPTYKNRYFKKLIEEKYENMYLFIFESKIIKTDNWRDENHQFFKRVYTWNDEIVDNEKIFKFFLPNRIPTGLSFEITQKKNFCCMIAGNKSINHNLELYSERVSAIRWFEQNHPEKFDLYGIGWNKPELKERVLSFVGEVRNFQYSNLLRRLIGSGYSDFPSYRGKISSKNEILRNYKFCICYENARDISGYITEKIFDCFFAGCIPIYWGASNITQYIPENTFIDRRKFDSYEQLYDFMVNMDESAYLDYIHCIESFVSGPKIYPFSADNFCATILRLITVG